jgi:hypothetical protein
VLPFLLLAIIVHVLLADLLAMFASLHVVKLASAFVAILSLFELT